MTPPDVLFVVLRALAFVAALQAAGVALFLSLWGSALRASEGLLRRAGVVFGVLALTATVAVHAAQPARMTGTFDGVLDVSLHAMLLASDAGAAHAVRILGLLLIVAGLVTSDRLRLALGAVGATLVAASFAFMGHTATHDQRWALVVLLLLHLLIAAAWFGALLAFQFTIRREATAVNALLMERFSSVAIWTVPLIFLAGLGMSVVLLPALTALITPYGLLLIAKILGFAILLALAAVNKWRLAPAIAAGRPEAVVSFRRSVLAEWILVAAVLAITAAMTALFSPAM